jgi:peptide/nickel transport system permease protein
LAVKNKDTDLDISEVDTEIIEEEKSLGNRVAEVPKKIFQTTLGIVTSSLTKYIAKKIFFALVSYFVAITIVFFLYHAIPGNPANVFALDPRVPPEVRDALLDRWGLNEPLWKQYGIFLRNLFQGDLGYSFMHKKPVLEVIGDYLPWTLVLLGSSFVLNGLIGIFLGAFVAWRRGSKLDTGFVFAYNVYNALPLFFTGMLFIALFGFVLQWFPTYGAQTPLIKETQGLFAWFLDVLHHLFLPLLVLAIAGILGWSWFMRGNLINILTEDYIQTARAKGLNENQVLYRHAFRNAILPVITDIGMSIGGIVGGAVLIETVFQYPGTGRLLYDALLRHDYPVVQGAFIIIAGLTLLGLLISEVIYGFVDPRIRTE